MNKLTVAKYILLDSAYDIPIQLSNEVIFIVVADDNFN